MTLKENANNELNIKTKFHTFIILLSINSLHLPI